MIPQVLSFGALVAQLATNFSGAKAGAEEAKKVLDGLAATYNVTQTGNLSKSASRLLVAPMTAIEKDIMHLPYMNDIMTIVNLRDIKDALAHLALQGGVNGIKIAELVDSINPRRAGYLSMVGAEAFGGYAQRTVDLYTMLGGEAAGAVEKPAKTPGAEKRITVGSKTYGDLTEYQPLAIGRTVDASVTIDGIPLTFPLTFRQIPMPITTDDIQTMFEAARPEDGFYGRSMMWRSGEITNPQFFTGTDVIAREFNIRNNDLSGYYKEAKDRESSNRMAALRTGVQSMNTMANTIIMSSDTKNNIEMEIGVSFDGSGIAKIRKAVLANTIVVVDDTAGVVTFYSPSTNKPEVWTIKQVTLTSKKDTSLDLQTLNKLLGGR